MSREKRDAVGVKRVKDKSDMVKVGVNDQKLIWKEHMERLMNVENKKTTLLLVRW